MKTNYHFDLEHFALESLKTMTYDELTALAAALRQKILAVVSTNGGHLSSNLGMVELTIALHKVFTSPKDKLLFDVSHQMYAHKILTGRGHDFSSLRTYHGISGFAKRSESIHDVYEAGHSSTILSAGIGFCIARVEKPDTIGDVVAVVGDASITNGLSFEALNYLGANKNYRMIIIINDNEMSISKNVGSLAKTFNRIRVKRHQRPLSDKPPGMIRQFSMRIKRMVKSYVYNNQFFTALGFKYFEGIDGHNIKELVKYLTFAKQAKQSIILHVKTQKGKGYRYAEEDNTGIWHGVAPFDIASGIQKNIDINRITYGEMIAEELVKRAKENPLIRVITPAMTLGSGLQVFKHECPNQFIDVGIAEENAVVMASAMRQEGLIPIVFIYSTFLQRCYDQILHDVARMKLPVIFCVDRSGIVDDDGDTHQGIFDVAFLRTIPYLTITMPKDANEALALLDLAFHHQDGPFVIRYPKQSFLPKRTNQLIGIPYGTWEEILPVRNKTIISYGPDIYELKANIEAKGLQSQIGLINARFLKPIDKDFLDQLESPEVIIYVYEQVIATSSLASAILEYNPKLNLTSVSLPETFLETGKVSQLKKANQIDIDNFIDRIK